MQWPIISCTHDDLMRTMRKNITFFGNPTLLSSRPKTDLMEAGGDVNIQRPSIAANSGFTSPAALSRSTFKSDPVSRGVDGQIRVPRVIANLEPNDRVGYIVPDAITGDQNAFARQYREEIRTALGGVDELSISAGVTATEYKSLFGRVAATSKEESQCNLYPRHLSLSRTDYLSGRTIVQDYTCNGSRS
jgi:hypothetical protein